MSKMFRVNGDRLWRRLNTMAAVGKTPNGGVCRLALTDIDKAGRDLFVEWCEAAGCSVAVDQIGNIFARRPGKNNELSPVLTGSHLDSQPTGGRFDGVYGVLAGLEVIETLNDLGIETESPLEVVVWTNEEGARFRPAMAGSGVFAGVFELHETLKISDSQGLGLGEELARIGYAGEAPATAMPIKAAIEAHIEQGPILEESGTDIGVVVGVQGVKWFMLTLTGVEVHAGPTPMELRRDPVLGAVRILEKLYGLVSLRKPWGRITFGCIETSPGVFNTVPHQVKISIDIRHPVQDELEELCLSLQTIITELTASLGLQGHLEELWDSPAVRFDPDCINAVRQAAIAQGYSVKEIVSGAGHDSVYLSRVAPTSMIFIPCEKGISHNEAENVSKEAAVNGCNVLLNAMLKLA